LPEVKYSFSRREALASTGVLFTGSTIARVFSAIGIFIVARQLGPEDFGQFAASLSISKLTSVLFSLGLDAWLLRNGSRGHRSLADNSGACLGIKVGLGFVWLPGIVLISRFLRQEAFPAELIALSAVSILLDELENTSWTAFKAELRNTVAAWLMISSQAALLLITLGLATANVQDSQGFLAGRVIASAAGSSFSVFLMVRSFGLRFKRTHILFVLKDTKSFALSHGLTIIYERADITIIAYWLGKAAAGVYSPATSLMTTLYLIPLAVYEVMLPIVSRVHVERPKSLRSLSFRLVLISALLGIVLGSSLTIASYPLVRLLYGVEYAASGNVLIVLSSILVFKCVSFALVAVLVAVGWQSKRLIVQAITAGFNIMANIAVIQTYGIMGVALVYVLTEGLLMLGYMILLLRWLNRKNLPNIGPVPG
jgi:O-antigen/teichoic acid export membrane protein